MTGKIAILHEVWKPDVLTGFDWVEVSSRGQVRTLDRLLPVRRKSGFATAFYPGQLIKPSRGKNGYEDVKLRECGSVWHLRVNRLVCAAFHGPPPTPLHDAAHRDGIRHHNTPGNLRWATRAENLGDRIDHGTDLRGEAHPRSVLTEAAVRDIRSRLSAGASRGELARRYGVTANNIAAVASGRTWAHVA